MGLKENLGSPQRHKRGGRVNDSARPAKKADFGSLKFSKAEAKDA